MRDGWVHLPKNGRHLKFRSVLWKAPEGSGTLDVLTHTQTLSSIASCNLRLRWATMASCLFLDASVAGTAILLSTYNSWGLLNSRARAQKTTSLISGANGNTEAK